MALNMSNPSLIMSIYSSILNNEYNWLLLHYTNDAYDELALYSYGVDGLEELKTRLSDLQEVFIAFYREEVDVDAGYIIINYIPSSVSAVKRARALVHSRRAGIIFKKHQAIYTVDSLSLITTDHVHQAITDLEAASSTRHPLQSADGPLSKYEHNLNIHSVSDYLQSAVQPAYAAIRGSPHDPTGNNTRQSSLDYVSHFPVVGAIPHVMDHQGGSFLQFLSRKKKKDISPSEMESLPPQPPLKDSKNVTIHITRSDIRPPRTHKILQRQRSHSMSDFSSVNFHAPDSPAIIVALENRHSQDGAHLPPFPLLGKWARKGAIPDPEERTRQRRDLQLQKEIEEQALATEEAERQSRLKLEKERVLRQEKEEEIRRLAEVEQELSRIRLERRRREQSEKEEEERQRRELEDRKQHHRKRRTEEHQRAEEWRREQAQKVEAAAREAAEIRRQEEGKRRERIQLAEAVVKQTKGEKDMTGWITMQSRDTVLWRRRYFKFVGSTMLLYRSAKDRTAPLENIDLRGKVGGLKEWYEGGYEDLEAIPFSFVVEFKDGRAPLSMYADGEEEKYKLFGLLRVAAGL